MQLSILYNVTTLEKQLFGLHVLSFTVGTRGEVSLSRLVYNILFANLLAERGR